MLDVDDEQKENERKVMSSMTTARDHASVTGTYLIKIFYMILLQW